MVMTNRRRLVLGAAALGACTAVFPAHAQHSGPIASDEEIARLLVARIDVQRRGTGGALGIVRDGRFSLVRHGMADLEASQRVGARSTFQIASLTKVFTAFLLADAVRRGEVSLDDPLDRHLPGPALSFEGRSVTLADLATHTSGLPLRPASRAARSQDDPYAGYSEADLNADLGAVRLTRPPGTQFEYSNFDYGLLGAALSHRLDRSYSDLLEARILDPLDMDETRLVPTQAMRRRMVQGYDAQFAPMRAWEFGALAPAGGLYSTLGDLRKFIDLWASNKGDLSRTAQSMFSISRPGDDANTRMALGWRLSERNGRQLAWSNGNSGGVRSFLGVAVGEPDGVIGFANMATGGGVDDIGFHVLDRSSPVDVAPVRERVAIAVPPALLDQYVGVYVAASGDPSDTATIVRTEEGIGIGQGAQHITLFAETSRLFFIREDNVTLEFAEPVDGRSQEIVVTQGGQTFVYRRPR
jgi:D-alanyl-D-alanine-carboxypeptidase/D-alanyl-D-alanine-endopeptidase